VNFVHKIAQKTPKLLQNRKFWLPTLLLAVGFGLGNVFYATVLNKHAVASNKKDDRSPYSSLAPSNKSEPASKEDIKTGYEQAKKRVETDLDGKKLTDDQANKLKQKIDEIYNYRKDLDLSKKEVRDDLQKKRAEWRNWLHDNNLPLKYVMSVYWN